MNQLFVIPSLASMTTTRSIAEIGPRLTRSSIGTGRKIALLMALSLGISLAFAQVQLPIVQPVAAVGDRWKFSTLDGITKIETGWRTETITAIGDQAIIVDVTTRQGQQALGRYDLAFNVINDLRGRSETEAKISFPLESGKTWDSKWDWINGNGQDGRMEMTYKVGAVERIKVAAGEFDTVFIDGQGRWYNKTSGNSGIVIEKRWYSPEAKRSIRRIWITRYSTGGADQNFIVEATEVDLQRK